MFNRVTRFFFVSDKHSRHRSGNFCTAFGINYRSRFRFRSRIRRFYLRIGIISRFYNCFGNNRCRTRINYFRGSSFFRNLYQIVGIIHKNIKLTQVLGFFLRFPFFYQFPCFSFSNKFLFFFNICQGFRFHFFRHWFQAIFNSQEPFSGNVIEGND